MAYWNSPAFKALQAEWYRRLEAEGFRDAEQIVGNGFELRQYAANAYQGADELAREIKAEYFRVLGAWVAHFRFAHEVDRIIMEMFAEGAKMKEICLELERRQMARCRRTVYTTIRKHMMLWGMREEIKAGE